MEITVLHIEDCPHVTAAIDVLVSLTAERPDVTISSMVVRTAEEATRTGMHGSPTILLDGFDPFAPPGTPTSLSCRVYFTPDGTSGLPDPEALAEALKA